MRLTISDIASKAGVSTATVSRVLNNVDHPVSEKTRRRVLAVARRCKYSMSIYGKGLAGQPNIIGLCIGAPLSVDPGFSVSVAQSIDGIKGAIGKRDYHVFLEVTGQAGSVENRTPFFAGVPLAGAIVMAPRGDNPLIPLLIRQKVPFIVLGSKEFNQCNYIAGDFFAAGREAVAHLADLGRRKIARLGDRRNFGPPLDMAAGVRSEVRRRNLPRNRAWAAIPGMSIEAGRTAALRMLQCGEPPDSFICYTDYLAVGVLQAAQELGLVVPDDVAVVGSDDFPVSVAARPQLTTFHHPICEMAAEAARQLIEDIIPGKPGEVVCQKTFEPTLVVRESCGLRRTRSMQRARKT